MRLVVFGLSVSSAWGNGHATLWRGLIRALAVQGHHVTFFERDAPWYAAHRDMDEVEGGELRLYSSWEDVRASAAAALAEADVGVVTSFCPDGIEASRLVLDAGVARTLFYDLDTPVTLRSRPRGEAVPWLLPEGLGDFDLVASHTGGRALEALRDQLGARRAFALYGHVDPQVHRPAAASPTYRADLTWLGTWAADRQAALERLFLEPARRAWHRWFLIGGSMYPADFPWGRNVAYVQHVPPSEHPAFYASSPLTLSVTREVVAELGYCPSARLFEAGACGTPVVTDRWQGIEAFFEPGDEILVADGPDDVLEALELDPAVLVGIGRRARERVLAEHTAEARARTLVDAIGGG